MTADNVAVASVVNDAPLLFPIGNTIVTWTVRDAAGNEAAAIQNITVNDREPPVISQPWDLTFEATAPETRIDLDPPTATDNLGVVSVTHDGPVKFPLGTTLVTWTAVDVAGNKTTATQNITLGDNTAPVVLVPNDLIIEAAGRNTMIILGEAGATDDLGVVSLTHDAPDEFSLGTTVVTWTAKDKMGNIGTAIQSVIVKDRTAPMVVAPPDVTADVASGIIKAPIQ